MKKDESQVIQLLDELTELVKSAPTIPLSTKVRVDPNELIDIIAEIRQALPGELKTARQIVAEQKQILFEAQANADRITTNAENKLREMIDSNEITRNANTQAEITIENAATQAKEIRIGTQKYADKILYRLQLQLKEINDQIEENRKEIKDLK